MALPYIQCPGCRGKRFLLSMGMMERTECEICYGRGIVENKESVSVDEPRKKPGRRPKVLAEETDNG